MIFHVNLAIFISVSGSVGSEVVQTHGCDTDTDMLCVRIDISAVSKGENFINRVVYF